MMKMFGGPSFCFYKPFPASAQLEAPKRRYCLNWVISTKVLRSKVKMTEICTLPSSAKNFILSSTNSERFQGPEDAGAGGLILH